MFRIATWNVNSLRVRLPVVLDWLARQQPDVLALQETKLADADFPVDAIQAAGYQVCFSGQKTYNGVAVLSRIAAGDILNGLPDYPDPQRRLLAVSVGDYRLVNVYIPNGSATGSDKYRYKLEWLDHLIHFMAVERSRHPNLILLGDFNIAPEDRDVYDPSAWQDAILCSPPERAAFSRLLESGLVDAFRLFDQPEKSYSWWDYRQQAFRRKMGLRIDHILIDQALAHTCTHCSIDTEPRKLERPSDHAPVILELATGS
ncbi:exodeoxyribonuclease III [Candidatus Woesearchaeota archaeon]|nr:exodeoxyribonuclease III [Candidatus Woesearchaeota archaeon]